MKKDFSILGNYLKEKREKRGFTQRQVSDYLGYSSPQFVSNVERGLCHLPLKAIRKLIGYYELDAREVYDILMGEQERILRKMLLETSASRRRNRITAS